MKRSDDSTGPWAIGDARIDFLVDLDHFAMRFDFLFPGVDKGTLAVHRDWLEPDFMVPANGDLLIAIQSAVLEIDGKVILIDTCVGENKPRAIRPDWNNRQATGYLDRLAALGHKPEDVDYVLCTHLHADHVGWNTRLVDGRWVPTFPNARYLVGRAEFAYWQSVRAATASEPNHGSYLDSVQPIVQAGIVDFVAAGDEIQDGLTIRALPGHTPGQIGLSLVRGGQSAMFVGDAIHHPVQLINPGWSTALDSDQDEARRSRIGFLEELAETGGLLVPGHFRKCRACHIERADAGGFRFLCD
jgi:glyoxylase-like metal-dependent hydrolase (beta-lactamase superfamily II)